MFWLLAAPFVLWKLAFGSWAVLQGERINAFAILRAAFYSPLAMGAEFQFDVFLSHSAKDKAVVRPLAERLRQDGLKVWPVPPERPCEDGFDEWVIEPGDSISAKIDPPSLRSYGGIEEGPFKCGVRNGECRMLQAGMSANAFGSDWAQLACPAIASARRRKAGTFRFRDPLNKERRFLPLRLGDAPIKGSLAQFPYINWRPAVREQEHAKIASSSTRDGEWRTLPLNN